MSIDPEDFKPKPERCERCGRPSVESRLYPWQLKLCNDCIDAGGCASCGHYLADCTCQRGPSK